MQLKAQIYSLHSDGESDIAALPVGSKCKVKHVKRSSEAEAHRNDRHMIYETNMAMHPCDHMQCGAPPLLI